MVTLGFPEDQAFLRSVADRRKSILEDGISAVLGHPVGVRCVATNLDLVPELPMDDDAAVVLAQARRIFGDHPQTTLEEGLRKMAAWARTVGVQSGKPFDGVEVRRGLPPSWLRLIQDT